MKKVLSIVLSLVIIIGLAGCIISLTNKENKGESSKESVNSSISSDEKIEDSSSTETPSDSSSSGEEVDDNINYTIVFESTEYPMTAKMGTTWATADVGAIIPPMTMTEDIWGMYYLESANVVWRLQNSDITYAFLDDKIVENEIYTFIKKELPFPNGLSPLSGGTQNFTYYEEGMVWGEWVESCHNTQGYYFNSTGLTKDGNIYIASDTNGTLVTQDEAVGSSLYYEYEVTL